MSDDAGALREKIRRALDSEGLIFGDGMIDCEAEDVVECIAAWLEAVGSGPDPHP